MLSKSLIQFSVEGWGSVPSLLFDMKPDYGGDNEDNGDLLQKVPCTHCCTQCPRSCSRALLTYASTRESWILTESLGQSLVGSLLLSPGSWCTRGFVCAHQEFISQSCVSFGGSMVVLMATSSKRAYAYPGLLYSEPLPLWQSTADSYLHRRHSQFSLRLYGDSGICLIG